MLISAPPAAEAHLYMRIHTRTSYNHSGRKMITRKYEAEVVVLSSHADPIMNSA